MLLSHCLTLKISAKEKYIKIGSIQAHAHGYEAMSGGMDLFEACNAKNEVWAKVDGSCHGMHYFDQLAVLSSSMAPKQDWSNHKEDFGKEIFCHLSFLLMCAKGLGLST